MAEWISIEGEGHPSNLYIVALHHKNGTVSTRTAFYHAGCWYDDYTEEPFKFRDTWITHWMPFPIHPDENIPVQKPSPIIHSSRKDDELSKEFCNALEDFEKEEKEEVKKKRGRPSYAALGFFTYWIRLFHFILQSISCVTPMMPIFLPPSSIRSSLC